MTSHPHYHRWVNMKAFGMIPEWRDDFVAFCRGIGDEPSPMHKLRKKLPGEILGPNNFRWTVDMSKAERKAANCEAARVRYLQDKADRAFVWTENNRNGYYRRKYGITLAEYNAMSEGQGHSCKICLKPETGRRLAVDHCHTTKRVRGLLCSSCNISIGRMSHDPAVLHRAIEYLKSAET